MDLFLDTPRDFGHVCVISRPLEALGIQRCFMYDPNRLIRPRYGKSRTRRLKKVSAGAFFRVSFERVEEPESLLASWSGRKVATVPDPLATPLPGFGFHQDDLILFGSEGEGISSSLLMMCDKRVTIPQPGVTQSLTLAVATGIVLFEFLRQEAEP